jgi:hypothetical protein
MDTSFEHFPEAKPPNVPFALATLLVVAISAGLGLFVYLETTKPEVVAYLQVRRSAAAAGWPKGFFDEESEHEFDSFRRLQIEMLHSKSLLVRAVRDPSISGLSFLRYKPDPVAWLKKNLKIDYPNDGELLRIRLSASDPIQAAQAVDAVVHAYFKEFVEKGTADRGRFEIKLREQLQEKSDSLLRDMHDADHLAQNLGDGAARSPELQLKKRRIAIEQETIDELVRHLDRLSIAKQFPARVVLLDLASELLDE